MSRNEDLEAAVLANPESPDVYLVYGDWLLEHGEPLGELVSLQAALVKSPRNASLRRRARALLAAHEREWLGPFARDDHEWAFGFLQGLSLSDPTPARYRALLELSAARFLRDLDIELDPHDRRANLSIVAEMAEAGLPRALRRLGLVTVEDDPNQTRLGDVSVLYPRLGELTELRIRAWEVRLGFIELPALQAFSLTSSIERDTLDVIGRARWPELASLSLTWTTRDVATPRPEAIAAALLPMRTPKLRHLSLVGTGRGDGLLRALSSSPHLAQLTSLDLSRNHVTDEGARELLSRKPAFAHLESIDLRENDLSQDLCDELLEAYDDVVDVDAQGEDLDEDDRYDEIQE